MTSVKQEFGGKEGVNTGRHFTAIHEYENDELTICYNLKGDICPEAFNSEDRPIYFFRA